MAVIEFIVIALALVAAGAYLEHKFGSKLSADVATLKSDVASLKSKAEAVDAAVKKAV